MATKHDQKTSGAHFLLRSEARTLSVPQVMDMTEDETRVLFHRLRWPETGGDPVCPRCECEAHYVIPQRAQFRYKQCNHTFSVTSGTIFASYKLPFRIYLLAILTFVNAAKGISALQLSRDLGVHYKTAFVMAHKLRHALGEQRDESAMTGEVEVDGAYVGGSIRPANRKEDRKDRRKAESSDKNCIIAIRQRGDEGAVRSLAKVAKSETTATVIDFVTGHVAGTAKVFTDENAAYDGLGAWYDHDTVNHSREYKSKSGVHINQTESMFSRWRRLEWGQVHHVSKKHMQAYADEISWREDTRRVDNGANLRDVLSKALVTPRPESFRGYWGRKRGKVSAVMAA